VNDLLGLAALAAGWYLFMRETPADAAEPVPQPSPIDDQATVEQKWPDYSKRAAGEPLPPSAEKPADPERPIAGFFKSVVVPPRTPRRISTPKVSNT
jgi:hypothetical protein